jgi:glycosyltransferase involved in cell wall biosynthesis
MPLPGVSVVIPALNAVGTLEDQLSAVLTQDCSVPIEVVVADNGSHDGTRNVVQSWADRDSRVRLVDAAHVPGEAAARNAGVEQARSPYVAFCDADDVVRPGWLAEIHTALASGSRAVSVTREYWSLNPGREANGGPETVITRWVAGGAFAVRRDLYLELGGFDTELPTAADTDFGFRLFDRTGSHPQQLPSAVVSVRQPQGAGQVFARARRLSRTRYVLRQRYPHHLSARPADVSRFRVSLLHRLVMTAPTLASSRRLGWLEMLGVLIGDIEGSTAGALPRSSRRP